MGTTRTAPSRSPQPLNSPQTLTFDQHQEVVLEEWDAVAKRAAQVAAIALKSAVKERNTASAILATGNTQLAFLKLLAADSAIPWNAIALFHLDEYLGLGGDHPASFQRYLRDRIETLVQPQAFHYLQGDIAEPISECDRYGALLPETVDLCCLGIGDNGHLAFNEPGLASLEDSRRVKVVRLAELTRRQQVERGAFSQVRGVPQYAITLTLPAIASARQILCLAIGRSKASIVQEMLQGPVNSQCPRDYCYWIKRLPTCFSQSHYSAIKKSKKSAIKITEILRSIGDNCLA